MSTEALYRLYKNELFSLAYRMLGSVMDAEDIVQEAFLAYDQLPDPGAIRNERAFLYKIATNRCLDLLRSSARKRELYVGPWLPEPLVGRAAAEEDPSAVYMQKETISMAYLLLLQQLNAVERAVFLLREIFHYSYEEIADMVGKSGANCRQIYRRAKAGIHFDPESVPAVHVAEERIKSFISSLMQGNTGKLLELLSENVVFYSDGGGKARAARIPVVGMERVLLFIQNLLAMYEGKSEFSFLFVNGMPGVRVRVTDVGQYVFSFAYRENRIETIYSIGNPDKLRHV